MKYITLMSLAIALLLSGCATIPQITIDYSPIYVPQESGYKFTQITDENDKLAATYTQTIGYTNYEFVRDVFDVSRSNDKIVFVANNNNSRHLFVKDLGNLRIKQQRTFGEYALNPSFSPDGTKIVFCDYRDKKWDVYQVDAAKGVAVQQITQTGTTSTPTYFPSGDKILFVRSESSYSAQNLVYRDNLWSYDVKNATLTQYGRGSTPSFFPNTQKVCVVRDGELWIYDLETGSEFNVLSSKEKDYSWPAVSPDGTQIAFHAKSKNIESKDRRDIYLINADGTNLRQITFHPGNDYQSKWSQDGKSLFFVSQRGNSEGTYNIWKIDLD